MAVGAVIARILTQYSDKGSKAAQKDIARLEKKINAFGKKAALAFGAASAAAVAYAVKLGVDAVKGAAEDEKQQVALATALRNTTGATEQAILANQKYLDQLELQVAIDNNQLIPALQKLATSTGDLAQAQTLLSLATDVSVASGKDLNSVSVALSKAVQGNFTALTRLGLPLDQNAVKAKDLGKVLVSLSNTSEGQAAAAADTFAGRLERLRLRVNQTADEIGYALMPVAMEFVGYIESDIVPLIQSWADANKDSLDDSLRSVMGNIKDLVDALKDIYGVLGAINAVIPFGVGMWLKLAVAVSGFSTAAGLALAAAKKFKDLKTMYAMTRGSEQGFKALRKELGRFPRIGETVGFFFAKISNWANSSKGAIALVTRGFIALNKAIFMTPWGRIALAVVGLGYALKKLAERFNWFGQGKNKVVLSDSAKRVEASMALAAKKTKSMDDALNAYKKTQEANSKLTQEQIDRNKRLAAINAKNAAAEKKAAAEAAKVAKLKADIEKLSGLKVRTEDDPIQLEAARILLVKQGNLAELEKLKRMTEEINLMKVRNDLAKRYDDILKALADNEISTKEIAILAEKWGVTKEAVNAYLIQFFAVSDGKIDDDEVTKLAKAWGSTEDQARQYLQFVDYLNDGILSDSEIQKLMKSWGLTEKQVRQYASFVAVVNDGKLNDSEVQKLMSQWNLTIDEVVDYIKKIGSPVSYSGTLIDPAKAAEIGWLSATAALERYLALLKAGTGVVTPPVVPPVVTPPTTTVTPQGPCGPSKPYYNYYTGECVASPSDIKPRETTDSSGLGGSRTDSAASAIAFAVAKAAGDEVGAAIAAAGVTPTVIASQESGAIGAASIAAQLAAAEQQVKIASQLAAFKAKEAADAAAAQAASAKMDYDERFRFQSSTINNGSGITPASSSGSPTIVVNVGGSVTTEQDLVSAVRTGLLQTQYNGNSLLLQAI